MRSFLFILLFYLCCFAHNSSFTASDIRNGYSAAVAGQSSPFSSRYSSGKLASTDLNYSISYLSKSFSFDSGKLSVAYFYYPPENWRQLSHGYLRFRQWGYEKDTILNYGFNSNWDPSADIKGFYAKNTFPDYKYYGITTKSTFFDTNFNFTSDTFSITTFEHNWSLNPNRWYIVNPKQNTKLWSGVFSKMDFSKLGKHFLFSYYNNGSFINYTPAKDSLFKKLACTEPFLVFFRDRLYFKDSIRSVIADSTEKPIVKTLTAGWNLVANPFHFPISIKNASPSDSISPFFGISDSSSEDFTYYRLHSKTANGSDSLEPYIGYFVYSYRSGATITFYPYIEPFSGLAKASAVKTWSVEIFNCESNIFLGEGGEGGAFNAPPLGASPLNSNGKVFDIRPFNSLGSYFDLSLPPGLNHNFIFRGDFPYERSVIYIADENKAVDLDTKKANNFISAGAYKTVLINGGNDYIKSVIADIHSQYPTEFSISPNYPNPFNPFTNIKYGVPLKDWKVPLSISILNIRGQVVYSKVLNPVPGNHVFTWNCIADNKSNVSSGFYFAHITLGTKIKTIKMVVLK